MPGVRSAGVALRLAGMTHKVLSAHAVWQDLDAGCFLEGKFRRGPRELCQRLRSAFTAHEVRCMRCAITLRMAPLGSNAPFHKNAMRAYDFFLTAVW